MGEVLSAPFLGRVLSGAGRGGVTAVPPVALEHWPRVRATWRRRGVGRYREVIAPDVAGDTAGQPGTASRAQQGQEGPAG